jgi:hypothetical protein
MGEKRNTYILDRSAHNSQSIWLGPLTEDEAVGYILVYVLCKI